MYPAISFVFFLFSLFGSSLAFSSEHRELLNGAATLSQDVYIANQSQAYPQVGNTDRVRHREEEKPNLYDENYANLRNESHQTEDNPFQGYGPQGCGPQGCGPQGGCSAPGCQGEVGRPHRFPPDTFDPYSR